MRPALLWVQRGWCKQGESLEKGLEDESQKEESIPDKAGMTARTKSIQAWGLLVTRVWCLGPVFSTWDWGRMILSSRSARSMYWAPAFTAKNEDQGSVWLGAFICFLESRGCHTQKVGWLETRSRQAVPLIASERLFGKVSLMMVWRGVQEGEGGYWTKKCFPFGLWWIERRSEAVRHL